MRRFHIRPAHFFLITGFALNMIYLLAHVWQIDSDMSEEMMLANYMNQTGSFAPAGWHYTTEVRAFNIQLLFRPLLLLFPDNWPLARFFAMGILYILYLLSFAFFISRLKIEKGKLWCLAALLWPIGPIYMFLGTWGGYYLVYATYSLLAFGLLLGEKKSFPEYGCMALLAFLTGLNGIKQAMIFYVPVFIAAVCRWLRAGDHTERMGKAKQFLFRAAFALLLNMCGALSARLLFAHYHYVDYFSASFIGGIFSGGFSLAALLESWSNFFSLFGYQASATVFSLNGLASCAGIAIGLLLLYRLLLAGQRVSEGSGNELEDYLISALIVDGISFSWLTATGNASYWLPQLPFAIVLLNMYTNEITQEHSARIMMGLLTAAWIFCSISTVQHEWNSGYRAKKGLYEVSSWLLNNHYTRGYASYWNADASVEMTSGQLEIWSVNDLSDLSDLQWGQPDSHFDMAPEKPYFILVDTTESDTAEIQEKTKGILIHSENGYDILEIQ